jgi:ATP-dependent helicase/nuclease subunit A
VHGSKGLQSPVLIVADACADPDRARSGPQRRVADLALGPDGETVPVFRPRKEEMAEPLTSRIALQDRLDREEHWRLLYVALTRAEERLYLGGTLGTADRNGPAEKSWFSAVQGALNALGCDWTDSALWGRELRHGGIEMPGRRAPRAGERPILLPDWLRRAAPAEERPPRPLAPSAIGEDDVPHPPPGADQRDAAIRGRLLHQLFERLPGVEADRRHELGDRWLERSAGVADPRLRAELLADACGIIEDARFESLFGPGALAEAPLAAVIGDGIVVSGTVDRLFVGEDRILVADFKTGRRAPASAEAIPAAHLRQMAAYRAALQVIFPDRPVEAALLYTAVPVLHRLPEALLAAHLP